MVMDGRTMKDLSEFALQSYKDIKAVVMGFDLHFNYSKLASAFQALQSPDCLFVTTNDDQSYPTENGLLPGISPPVEHQ